MLFWALGPMAWMLLTSIKPDNLVADLQNANDFTSRFKALKAEYDARVSCATKIGQSLRDVTLPDMAQAPIAMGTA